MQSPVKVLILRAVLPAVTLLASVGMAAAAGNDSDFLQNAISNNMADVQAGQLAAQKGSSPAVKQLGQSIVASRTETVNAETSLANAMQVQVPASAQAGNSSLSGLSGTSFDQAYLDMTIARDQQLIADYQQAAQGGNAQVAALAQKALPDLQSQLQTAQMLRMRMREHNTP